MVVWEDNHTRLFNDERINIIPIHANDKRPAIEWGSYQNERYPREKLKGWTGNFAAICGRVSSNLVVVDVDDPRLYDRFLKGVDTFTVRTPNGGYHLYFFAGSETKKAPKFRGFPIDIQGEGSYVLIPPSAIDEKRYGVVKDVPILERVDVGIFLSERLPKQKRRENIEGFKHRVDISKVIERYVTREVEGRGYWQGKCPFHRDEHPSLTVYEDRYYCFGCQAHGDVIDFIERIEGVDFKRALCKLEDLTGIRLQTATRKSESESEPQKPKVQSVGLEFQARVVELCDDEGTIKFCVYDGSKLDVLDSIDIGESLLVPFSKPLWPLPRVPQLKKDHDLFDDVRSFIERHWDYPKIDSAYDVMSAACFWSYFVDRVGDSTPYLGFIGPYGSGKTRGLLLLRALGRKLLLTPSITEAGLARSIGLLGTGILSDEKDFKQYPELLSIYNAGYQRGSAYIRVNPEKVGLEQLEFHNVYGFKAWASRRGQPQPLESRSVMFRMERNIRAVPTRIDEEVAKELRTRLLAQRMLNLRCVSIPDRIEGVEDNRIVEIFAPLVAMTELFKPDATPSVVEYAKEAQQDLDAMIKTGFEAAVLQAMAGFLETMEVRNEEVTKIPVSELVDAINRDRSEKEEVTPTWVGRTMSGLGFRTTRYTGGKRAYTYDAQLFDRLAKRYGVERVVHEHIQ